MQTYEATTDKVIQEDIGEDAIYSSAIVVTDALVAAREDRHESIRGMVLMIQALTDSVRRDLYLALGVHPL